VARAHGFRACRGTIFAFDALIESDFRYALAMQGDDDSWLWCTANDNVYTAIHKMSRANVGSLIVLDSGNTNNAAAIRGIFTERDYMKKIVLTGKNSSETSIYEIMTPKAAMMTIGPKNSVMEAMDLMVENQIRHLPVLDGDRILGMVSIRDVVSLPPPFPLSTSRPCWPLLYFLSSAWTTCLVPLTEQTTELTSSMKDPPHVGPCSHGLSGPYHGGRAQEIHGNDVELYQRDLLKWPSPPHSSFDRPCQPLRFGLDRHAHTSSTFLDQLWQLRRHPAVAQRKENIYTQTKRKHTNTYSARFRASVILHPPAEVPRRL